MAPPTATCGRLVRTGSLVRAVELVGRRLVLGRGAARGRSLLPAPEPRPAQMASRRRAVAFAVDPARRLPAGAPLEALTQTAATYRWWLSPQAAYRISPTARYRRRPARVTPVSIAVRSAAGLLPGNCVNARPTASTMCASEHPSSAAPSPMFRRRASRLKT